MRITVIFHTMICYPACCNKTIVCCCREFIFRGASVINGKNNASTFRAKMGADGVIVIEAKEDPTSSMEKDHYRERSFTFRDISPDRKFAARTGNNQVLKRSNRCDRDFHPGIPSFNLVPGLINRDRINGSFPCQRDGC
jgi:hypothetical protein